MVWSLILELTVEIEKIMKKHLMEIVRRRGLETLIPRFRNVIRDALSKVDLENYGVFKAIMLVDDLEWEGFFVDLQMEERNTARDVVDEFTKVGVWRSRLIYRLSKTMNQLKKKLIALRQI
jgi:hypothetical protein